MTLQRSVHLFFILVLSSAVFLVGSAIIRAQDTHTGNHGQANNDAALAEQGYEVFVTNGCTACHGQNAEGNDIGPALAGHSEFAVRRQVRAPTNIMLPFSPAQIPAEDLDALVAYILSLEVEVGGEHANDEHNMSSVITGDLVFAHHWLLWLSLETDDVEDSIHHTNHILELLTDGPHKTMMQALLTTLETGNLDTARPIVESMVTDVGEFSDDIYTVGMQLTYQTIYGGDHESAIHFATDLSGYDLTDDELQSISTLLELIESCELDEAMSSIEMVLGDDVFFYPDIMNMSNPETGMNDHMNMNGDHSSGETDERFQFVLNRKKA